MCYFQECRPAGAVRLVGDRPGTRAPLQPVVGLQPAEDQGEGSSFDGLAAGTEGGRGEEREQQGPQTSDLLLNCLLSDSRATCQ